MKGFAACNSPTISLSFAQTTIDFKQWGFGNQKPVFIRVFEPSHLLFVYSDSLSKPTHKQFCIGDFV